MHDRQRDDTRSRAEMNFRKRQELAKDAPKAVADYHAAFDTKIANMHRLRKLREAKAERSPSTPAAFF